MDVAFLFAGLFDTVSAHGLRTDHLKGDDVEKLRLALGGSVQKVLQLTAENEYRMNFCLTDIQTSIDSGTGFEYEMPGSHSDIGGGCKDPVVERLVDYRKLVDKLISEGWYTEEQKETVPGRYSPSPVGGMPVYNPAYCKARRTVSNAYQYIPMEIMVNFAKKYGKMAFDESELKKHTAKIPDDLQPYRKALVADAGAQDGAHHRKADLKGLDVKKLRNKYLHLTASREGGGSGIIDWLVNRGRYPGRGIIKG